jgi:excisionase family DNA binding protein
MTPKTIIPLLTLEDVAEHCRVSIKTVRRWVHDRDLLAFKLGSQWRVRPEDLRHFILDRLER